MVDKTESLGIKFISLFSQSQTLLTKPPTVQQYLSPLKKIVKERLLIDLGPNNHGSFILVPLVHLRARFVYSALTLETSQLANGWHQNANNITPSSEGETLTSIFIRYFRRNMGVRIENFVNICAFLPQVPGLRYSPFKEFVYNLLVFSYSIAIHL